MQNYQRINKYEVASLVGVSPRTLFNHVTGGKCSPMLHGLPEPVTRGHGVPLMWITQDVLDWLESQRTYRFKRENPGEPIPMGLVVQDIADGITTLRMRKRGRPSNASRGAAGGAA